MTFLVWLALSGCGGSPEVTPSDEAPSDEAGAPVDHAAFEEGLTGPAAVECFEAACATAEDPDACYTQSCPHRLDDWAIIPLKVEWDPATMMFFVQARVRSSV